MIRPRPHQSLQCRCVACEAWWVEVYGANAERVRKTLTGDEEAGAMEGVGGQR